MNGRAVLTIGCGLGALGWCLAPWVAMAREGTIDARARRAHRALGPPRPPAVPSVPAQAGPARVEVAHDDRAPVVPGPRVPA